MSRYSVMKVLRDVNVPQLVTSCAADHTPRNIDFLWGNGEGKIGGRLARGKHTCIAGEGGLGKSTLVYDIIARITTGGQWPCNEGRAPIGNVILLSAEDDVDDIIIPKLMAAGADRNRVKIVHGVSMGPNRRRFDLQEDLRKLEDAIAEFEKVALVTIDPVSSYMGKVDSHNNTALRGVLDPISEMAERANIAFLSVTHFNKGSGDKGIKAVNRVMGGGAFTHAPRAAFAVVEDPDDTTHRLLLSLKNNLGAPLQGLAYWLSVRMVGKDERTEKEIYASHVEWLPEPVKRTANEIMGGAASDDLTATDDAAEFLEMVLRGGFPVPVAELEQSARDAGLLAEGQPIGQSKPFRAAAKRLGVRRRQLRGKGERHSGWLWSLSGSDAP